MHQRFIFGSLAVSILCCLAVLDAQLASAWLPGGVWGDILSRGSLMVLVFAALVVAGGLEMTKLLRSAGLRPHAGVAIVMSVVLLVSPWLCATNLLSSGLSDLTTMHWQVFWLAVLVIAAGVAQLTRGITETAIADLGVTCLMGLYLGLLPSFAIQLRCAPSTPGLEAAWLVLAFLLITKVSDIGAYLVGTLIGRHKLLPAVSPGKSIEGAVGGVVASALLSLGISRIYFFLCGQSSTPLDDLTAVERITSVFRVLEPWQAIVFGVLMSIFGQVGDLLESVLKRAAHEKDSGSLMPSFGGVLDLIDSPILAAPVAWFVLTMWWEVV